MPPGTTHIPEREFFRRGPPLSDRMYLPAPYQVSVVRELSRLKARNMQLTGYHLTQPATTAFT
jgi:hypothetical protein